MTTLEIARMRLVAQRLVGPPEPDAATVVRHLTCVQAQDWTGSCTSIALRSADRAVAGVHASYDSGAVVRSWPMRGTLHAVPAQDLGWMLALTRAGMLRRGKRMRAELGLTASVLDDVETWLAASCAAAG